MKFAALLMMGVSLGLACPAAAQTGREGVQSFQQSGDSWRRAEEDNQPPVISQSMIDAVGNSGIANITDSEAVFCYQVSSKPAGYKGYTIDNMAVTGFCGIIENDLKNMIIRQFFATPENISQEVAQCVIKPRLMLRFVRGVDYTDVLLSSPCHSFSAFYGGKVKSYNFSPAAEIIDVMVDSFRPKTVPFVSPAMLRQLLPIGVAQTQSQKDMVAKQSGPIRNWDTQSAPAKPAAPKKSGWNNLNL